MNDFDTRLKSNYADRLSIYDEPVEDEVTIDTLREDFEDMTDDIRTNIEGDNEGSHFLTVEEVRAKAQEEVHADINGDNDGRDDIPEELVPGVEEEFEEYLVDEDPSGETATNSEETQRAAAQAELDSITNPQTNSTDTKTSVDSFLVTQATITVCLGLICETVNSLAGDGLSLALADGSIPDNSEVRRIVSKGLYSAIQERSLSFKNMSEGSL